MEFSVIPPSSNHLHPLVLSQLIDNMEQFPLLPEYSIISALSFYFSVVYEFFRNTFSENKLKVLLFLHFLHKLQKI